MCKSKMKRVQIKNKTSANEQFKKVYIKHEKGCTWKIKNRFNWKLKKGYKLRIKKGANKRWKRLQIKN